MVSTASYEARAYGIHSAMPLKQAYLRCPQAHFLPVDMAKYKKISSQIHRIFRRYTSLIEPVSLDEAFLDVTGADAVVLGREIKDRIREEVRLTASVGISYNKFLAKLASDMEKPDGFTVIPRENVEAFLAPLPVGRIWGVGPRTQGYLNNLGIFTIGDLQRLDRDFLVKTFGKWGNELYLLARGIDNRPVKPSRKPKSLGEELTFPRDEDDPEKLRACLAEFAQALGQRLKKKGPGRPHCHLESSLSRFCYHYQKPYFPNPTDQPEELYRRSLLLLERAELNHRRVRLIGLTVSNFVYPGEPYQLTLW